MVETIAFHLRQPVIRQEVNPGAQASQPQNLHHLLTIPVLILSCEPYADCGLRYILTTCSTQFGSSHVRLCQDVRGTASASFPGGEGWNVLMLTPAILRSSSGVLTKPDRIRIRVPGQLANRVYDHPLLSP